MNAMEKVAWTELLVSLTAVVVVTALLPWFGRYAYAGFALLALLACSGWFLQQRGKRVITDERDRDIDQQALRLGVSAAWMALFLSLIAIVFWSAMYNDGAVPTLLLTWLIFIQFAICYGVKGFAAVVMHRRQSRAA